MVETDEKGGHDNGWMSEEYLRRISIAIDNVKRVIETYGDEYSVIIMADHGGHDRSHGTEMPEDMLIPIIFNGKKFKQGNAFENAKALKKVTLSNDEIAANFDAAKVEAEKLGIPVYQPETLKDFAIKELLEERGVFVVRNGDDLMINGRKLSVSIVTKSVTSILIHTGLNIISEGAPVKASGLKSELGLEDVRDFALEVMKRYSEELEDIVLATTKVRGV